MLYYFCQFIPQLQNYMPLTLVTAISAYIQLQVHSSKDLSLLHYDNKVPIIITVEMSAHSIGGWIGQANCSHCSPTY